MSAWPNPFQGTSLFVQWANRLLAACKARQIISSPDYLIEQSPNGTILKFRISGGTTAVAISVSVFNYTRSFGNYVLTSQGTSIAKPPKLQNSIAQETIYGTLVGFTYPHNVANDVLYGLYRHASITGVGSENQGVVPQYLVGNLIYAVKLAATGVVSEAADGSQPVGTPIVWQDINADGRAWARFSNQNF